MGAPVTPTLPFATVDMMSSYLRVEISPVDVIARLALAAATSMIQDYTDQLIAYVEDETVILDGSGNNTMLLPELPVTSVSLVIQDSDTSFPKTLLDQSNGSNAEYTFVGGRKGMLIRRKGRFVSYGDDQTAQYGCWPGRRQSVTVTYTHGYPVIPAELQLLCVTVASRAWAQDGATQETVGTYIAQYAGQPGVLTEAEMKMLGRYRTRKS